MSNEADANPLPLVHIMWTKTSRSPFHAWEPNHFIPLMHMSSQISFSTYSDAVKHNTGSESFSTPNLQYTKSKERNSQNPAFFPIDKRQLEKQVKQFRIKMWARSIVKSKVLLKTSYIFKCQADTRHLLQNFLNTNFVGKSCVHKTHLLKKSRRQVL